MRRHEVRFSAFGVGPALAAAAAGRGELKVMGVQRRAKANQRWRSVAHMVSDVPLHTWIAFQASIGIDADTAAAEWHGARTAHRQR